MDSPDRPQPEPEGYHIEAVTFLFGLAAGLVVNLLIKAFTSPHKEA